MNAVPPGWPTFSACENTLSRGLREVPGGSAKALTFFRYTVAMPPTGRKSARRE